MVNRLKEKYDNEIVPSLMEKFNYTSIMQAPKVDKIVINMGVGDAVSNAVLIRAMFLRTSFKRAVFSN